MGTGAAEQLEITNTHTLKALTSVKINTKTEGTGADAGKIEFSVDDNPIFYIGDNGLYGIEDEDGYCWQIDGVAGNEDFDYPQLDGFYINGGLF